MMSKITKHDQTIYEYGNINGGDWIRIEVCDSESNGTIQSNLKNGLTDDKEDVAYGNAVDGLESMLLALACEGFDLGSEKGEIAIQTALEALDNIF